MRTLALALFASQLVAARASSSTPSVRAPAPPAAAADADATLTTLLEIADGFGLPAMRAELVAPMLRIQHHVRDAAHRLGDELAALARYLDDHVEPRIPDLRVLQVEPVANASTSGFGWRDDPIRHRSKFHAGADIKGDRGTPVMASGDGVVVFCGRKGGYGNVIFVDHGGGVVTRYAHLSRIETRRGAVVVAGQRIGRVGSTGRATGPHLHFEVRLDGHPVDPVTALAVAELARTSPAQGRVAAHALAPEVQAHKLSDVDPPKRRHATSRPDRPGRVKRPKPVS